MLDEFIEANGLKAEIIKCKHEVITASDVSDLLKIPLEQVIKTILFIDSNNEPVLAILLGNDRVSREKLCRTLKTDSLRTAEPNEVFEITGYEVGGVPPISVYGVKTVMDKKVKEKEFVVGGGGDIMHLLRISPKEIEENAEGILIVDIAE